MEGGEEALSGKVVLLFLENFENCQCCICPRKPDTFNPVVVFFPFLNFPHYVSSQD